ncbi:MAG: sigma-70 family RNA polymerase sigma factor [Dongiaceae bacterium]
MDTVKRERKFEALVVAYGRTLYRYAYWLCKDATAAEDLVQVTLMKAWEALDQLRNEKAALSWLLTILRREHYRAATVPERRAAHLALESIADLASPATIRIDALSIRRAILTLPRHLREPLVLRLLEDLSVVEISSIMDLSVANVTTRLFRARRAIRQHLLEGGHTELSREVGT